MDLTPAQEKLLRAVAATGDDGYELPLPRGRSARRLRDDYPRHIRRRSPWDYLMVLTEHGQKVFAALDKTP